MKPNGDFYYNTMNDVLFKFIFGKEQRKHITIDFLNAVLAESLGHKIKNLFFASTEKSPRRRGGKGTRLDVVCTLDTRETVDIEVQVVNQKNMIQRSLYYWAQMYADSLTSHMDYDTLKSAIMVNIVNFAFLSKQSPHSIYDIRERETGERYSRDLEIHFLEVPKLLKNKAVREMNAIEKWLAYFSKHYDTQAKEEIAMSEPAIKDAMEATEVFMANAKERYAYYNRERAIRDWNQSILASRREGEKRGETRLGILMEKLLTAKRYNDAREAALDINRRKALYEEFHL